MLTFITYDIIFTIILNKKESSQEEEYDILPTTFHFAIKTNWVFQNGETHINQVCHTADYLLMEKW